MVNLTDDQDSSNDTLTETVTIVSMMPLDFAVTHEGNFLYGLKTNQIGADSIHWDFDGQGSAFGDTVSFQFAEKDSFEVCMTVYGSCNPGLICKMIYKDGFNVTRFDNEKLRVFPNPNNGRFTLDFTNSVSGDVSLKLIDIQGKQIMEERMMGFSGSYHKTFDFTALASGVYILHMQSPEGIFKQRIIIQ